MQFTYDSVTILSVSGLMIAAYYYIYPPKNSMSLNSFANIFFNKFHPLKIHLKLNKKKEAKHWTLIEIKIGSEFTLHDLVDPWHPILNKSSWKFLAPLFSFISVMTASAALLLVVRLYCLMVSKMGDIIVYIFLVSIIKPIVSFYLRYKKYHNVIYSNNLKLFQEQCHSQGIRFLWFYFYLPMQSFGWQYQKHQKLSKFSFYLNY